MFKKVILTVTGLLFLASLAMAAPVKVPVGGKDSAVVAESVDGKLLLSVGAEYDNVFERKLEENSEAEFNAISGEIALEYNKNVKGYVTLYDLGSTNADNNVGVFIGTRITPTKDVSMSKVVLLTRARR